MIVIIGRERRRPVQIVDSGTDVAGEVALQSDVVFIIVRPKNNIHIVDSHRV